MTDGLGKSAGTTFAKSALFFFAAAIVLFLSMSLAPNVYDEGLILTGAMRVAAGQIPHRDFYIPYGPAQLYVLAGLFKLFGTSLLVERLFDLLLKALLIAVVFATTSFYCHKPIPAAAGFIAGLSVFGLLDDSCGLALTPVSLLNLASTFLILPVIQGTISKRRIFGVGALAGCAALFRYDTGLALFAIHISLVLVAVHLTSRGTTTRLRTFVSILWPYLLGFAAVFLPPAIYYLSVAPLHPFIHDIFLFPSKYYRSGRNLPFPNIGWKTFDNITIYLIILAAGMSIYYGSIYLFRRPLDKQNALDQQRWHWLLFVFGVLALGMYCKGFVRISLVHLVLAIIPCFLLLAVLVEKRMSFRQPVRVSILCLAGLFAASAAFSSLRELRVLYRLHPSLAGELVSSLRGTIPEMRVDWCNGVNPLTKGICFLPDDDRIRTTEFLASHTQPDEKLFVGLKRHDIIFANDNLIYFAVQRLPATRWSHFDPGLQNRYDIQTEMIRELQKNAPPYIVRDSEFDLIKEPNTSSVSTGVRQLDDYIDRNYHPVKTYGPFSIWQRKNGTF